MDGTGDHDIKWNKSVPQRHVSHVFSLLWKQGWEGTRSLKQKGEERWKRKGKGGGERNKKKYWAEHGQITLFARMDISQ
jgi:hypothetical protein